MTNKAPSVYSLLVKDKDDFLGILAYSVYRRQKQGLTDEPAEDGDGTSLKSKAEAFGELSRSSAQLELYRDQALKLADSFTDALLSESIKAIQKKLETEYHAKLEATRPSFAQGVWASVVASFVFTLLLGIFVFFTWSLKQGPRQVIENIFDVKIIAVGQKGNAAPASPEAAPTSAIGSPTP